MDATSQPSAVGQNQSCFVRQYRSDDRFLALRERTDRANQLDADLFLSIHANAARNRRTHGVETYLLDHTRYDRQTARVAGSVLLERSDAGYLFTVEAADPYVLLEISSGVARQVGGACRTLALIPFVDLPCNGIEKALSTVRVPTPEPGERFEVPAELLSVEEKAFFDRLAAKATQ